MTVAWMVLLVLVVLIAATLASTRVLREYERGVCFRLGRLRPLAGPGPVFLLPFVDRLIRVDLRTVTLTIPPQEVITRDNVPARVNAVAYFRVVKPELAITEVEAYPVATSQIAQTTLRSVLGRAELDTLLSERDELNDSLRRIIDEQTEPWGITTLLSGAPENWGEHPRMLHGSAVITVSMPRPVHITVPSGRMRAARA